jgi:hypothetical protein
MIILSEEILHLINDNETVLWAYSQKYKYMKSTIKKLNLNPPISEEERKNYKNVYILTNKRWIQKDLLRELHDYVRKYSEEIIKRERDVISININDIKIWYIIDTIGIYVEKTEYNSNKPTYLGADVPRKVKQKLIDVLMNLPQFKYEKGKFGANIFYTSD